MAPTSKIYLTRHSQAEHNVANDYSIPDAPLTDLGKSQSANLVSLTIDLQNQVQVILSSGLKRTLQSTKIGYSSAITRLGGLDKVVVLPQLQECNDFPCDTGSDRSILESDAELLGFDFSNLTQDWNSKQGFYSADDEALNKRANWIRKYLCSRTEDVIVVMAHGDILRKITNEPYPWKNAQVRLFQFNQELIETDECPLEFIQDIAIGEDQDPSSSLLTGISSIQQQKLSEMEERVKQRQSMVFAKTEELQQLQHLLQLAEKRKKELEAARKVLN